MEIFAKTKDLARPKMRLRGGDMWTEQMQNYVSWTTLVTFDHKANGLQSQCKLRSPHKKSWTFTMRSYKSNRESTKHGVSYGHYMWAITALPYQHRISSRDLSVKKLGILRTEMIFTLPRCLLLRVMWPLYLEELDCLVASLVLGRVKNTDWTLWVGKVRTQLDLAQVNGLHWLFEALL